METKQSNKETQIINIKPSIKLIALCSLLLIDYGIYSLTKLIKNNENCLKTNECSLSFN